MKQCRNCKQDKTPEEFHKHKRTKDGLNSWCKVCVHEYSKSWLDANRERYSLHRKERRLKERYGLTLSQVEEMKQAQNNACMICEDVTELVVDHNHTSGAVRGLLCHFCNTGIGSLREDPKLLTSAIQYLEKFN